MVLTSTALRCIELDVNGLIALLVSSDCPPIDSSLLLTPRQGLLLFHIDSVSQGHFWPGFCSSPRTRSGVSEVSCGFHHHRACYTLLRQREIKGILPAGGLAEPERLVVLLCRQ